MTIPENIPYDPSLVLDPFFEERRSNLQGKVNQDCHAFVHDTVSSAYMLTIQINRDLRFNMRRLTRLISFQFNQRHTHTHTQTLHSVCVCTCVCVSLSDSYLFSLQSLRLCCCCCYAAMISPGGSSSASSFWIQLFVHNVTVSLAALTLIFLCKGSHSWLPFQGLLRHVLV